ncbi:MAG: hypothetical protein ACOYBY_15395 [Dermatophilaceae bacterium]
MAAAAAQAGRTDAATIIASVPLALAATPDAAAGLAARWLLAYATRMGPVYPRMLRTHGYGQELDALLDANHDSPHARLPAAAERLARDVLLYGTYDQAPTLCKAWLEHADALSVVAPFGVPAEHIAESMHAIAQVHSRDRRQTRGTHLDPGHADVRGRLEETARIGARS